ncbi:MAG: metal ABC transporter permease, partial [Gammaproteobacteria bacterium]
MAALITGVIAPAIGTFRVQRRLSLLGDGLGHLAVAGVGLALLTGTAPLPLHEGDQGQPVPQRLAALGLSNALAHGTPTLPGGSTFFLLCGLPHRPGPREAGDLRVLLPALALVVMLALIFTRQPRAMSYFGLTLLLNFSLPLVFASMAQLCVIAVGDIDLGIGPFISLVN